MQHFLVPYRVQLSRLNNGLLRVIRCLAAAMIAVVITIFSLLTLGQMATANTNSDDIPSLSRFVPSNSPLFASLCDYQTRILTDNPIAYWRLGETSGNTATNIGSLGNAVDGSYTGGITLGQDALVPGESDTAVRFDGIDDRINIPDHDAINTGKFYNARTIELWFKADTVGNRQILYEEGGDLRGLNIYIDSGELYVNAWNVVTNGGVTAPWGPSYVSTAISTDTAYHTALVFEADTTGPTTTLTGTITGYLNGVSFGVVSGAGQLFGHGDDIGIGSPKGSSFYHDGTHGAIRYRFTGIIDEVVLFNDSLTSTQIQNHSAPCPSGIYLPVILANG